MQVKDAKARNKQLILLGFSCAGAAVWRRYIHEPQAQAEGFAMLKTSRIVLPVGAVALMVASLQAGAQSLPDSENGRYTFTPTADGVLRLDTRTGSLASCHNRVAGWSCYAVPDERAALDAEIGRLTRENTQLKDDLKRMKDEQARLDRDIAALKDAQRKVEAERTKLKDEQVRFDREIAALKEASVTLGAERTRLKEELDKRDVTPPKIDAPLAKEDLQKKGVARDAGRSNRLELQLPDDREVERAVAFLERAWRRLIEMANRVQRDVSGKI